jgi:hypothetical protein
MADGVIVLWRLREYFIYSAECQVVFLESGLLRLY